MAESKYPENEKLSFQRSEWSTLVDFMEFLSSEKIQLVTWVEREWEETCRGSLLNECVEGFVGVPDSKGDMVQSGRKCPTCNGDAVVTKHFKGYETINSSTDALIHKHLQVDPVKLEAERRDMLASLGS